MDHQKPTIKPTEYQILCLRCDEGLKLGEFRRKDTGIYIPLRRFIMKHQYHIMKLTEVRQPIDMSKVNMNIGTAAEKQAWLHATRLLLFNIVEMDKKYKSDTDDNLEDLD